MELEQMTLDELVSIKGGAWVEINGEWFWIGKKSLFPESKDE